MPIYEYKCEKCGKIYELSVKDNTLNKIRCCDGWAKKQVSLSSFHLKGEGFYKNDYREDE